MLLKQSVVIMLFCLVTWLWFVNPCLLYVIPVALFITSGRGVPVLILLYCVIMTYDKISSTVISLSWYLYVAFLSGPYLGQYLSELINNCTQSMGKTGGGYLLSLFHLPFSLLVGYNNF